MLKNAFRKSSINLRMISLVSNEFVDGKSGSHWGWCMVEIVKKLNRLEVVSGRYSFNTSDKGRDSKFNQLASTACSAMRDVFRKCVTDTINGGVHWGTGGPKWVRKDNDSNPAERIQVPQQTNGHNCGVLSIMACSASITSILAWRQPKTGGHTQTGTASPWNQP